MANFLAQLPAYQVNANPINFAPINNALDSIRQQQNLERQFGLQQQASNRADQELALNKQTTAANLRNSNLEYEKSFANLTGGVAQSALALQDPAARAKVWQGIVSSHPDFAKNLAAHGVDPNDTDAGLNFVVNEAKGYQNPLDVEAKRAAIDASRAGTAINQQKLQLAKRQFEFTSNLINGANGQPPKTAAAPPMQGARQAPDGRWYVSDPNRPGKYLMVQP